MFKSMFSFKSIMALMVMHVLPNNDLAGGLTTEGTYTPDQLFAGESKIVTRDDIIVSGAGVIVKGQVLARVTASGKLTKHNPGGSGGAEIAVAIASQPCDATSVDCAQAVFVGGVFNRLALTWHASTNTKALQRAAFDPLKTIVIDEVAAV